MRCQKMSALSYSDSTGLVEHGSSNRVRIWYCAGLARTEDGRESPCFMPYALIYFHAPAAE